MLHIRFPVLRYLIILGLFTTICIQHVFSPRVGLLEDTDTKSEVSELAIREHEDERMGVNNLTNPGTSRSVSNVSEHVTTPVIPSSFLQKSRQFYKILHRKRNIDWDIEISVRRSHILEDSFSELSELDADDIKKGDLSVVFYGEEGVDDGGLTKEWFQLLSKEMFNPQRGLFEYCNNKNYDVQINPLSGCGQKCHLSYFSLIGILTGIAVYHQYLLDVSFSRPFLKSILKEEVEMSDVEHSDPQFYKSLVWILENDPRDLSLTFRAEDQRYGKIFHHDLLPDGDKIEVNEHNKKDYVKLLVEWRYVTRVQEQTESFLKGFKSLIPSRLIKTFNADELQLLISGLETIDVTDWRQNTTYEDYTKNSEVVVWFWQLVTSFNNENRAKLLQFVTGTSRIPANGFKELSNNIGGEPPFTIKRWGTPNNYPLAHTCSNKLDLPPYRSFKELSEKLATAINNSSEFLLV